MLNDVPARLSTYLGNDRSRKLVAMVGAVMLVTGAILHHGGLLTMGALIAGLGMSFRTALGLYIATLPLRAVALLSTASPSRYGALVLLAATAAELLRSRAGTVHRWLRRLNFLDGLVWIFTLLILLPWLYRPLHRESYYPIMTAVAAQLGVYMLIRWRTQTRADLRWVTRALVIACTVGAVTVWLQLAGWDPGSISFDQRWFNNTATLGLARPTGTFGDPNFAALILVGSLPLAIAAARTSARPWVWWAQAGVQAVAVLTTVSRMGFLLLLLLGLLYVRPRAVLAWVRRRRAIAATLAAALALILVMTAPTVGRYVQQMWTLRHLVTLDVQNDMSLNNRYLTVLSGLKMIQQAPLLGVGPGQYQWLVGTLVDFHVPDVRSVAHNAYLEVAAELGVFGLLAFGGILWGAWRAFRMLAQGGGEDPLARGLSNSLLLAALGSLFLSSQYDKNLWILWSLAAATLQLHSPMDALRRPLRVVHLLDSDVIGGAEKYILALLAEGRTAGADQRLILLRQGPLAAVAASDELPVETYPLGSGLSPRRLLQFSRFLRELQPDLIHTHGIKANLIGLIAGLLIRRPVVTTKHGRAGLGMKLSHLRLRLLDWLDTALTRLGNEAVFPVSAELAALWSRRLGAGTRLGPTLAGSIPVAMLQQGAERVGAVVWPEHWQPAPPRPLLVTVARLSPEKGLDLMLRALALVRQAHPGAGWIVLGDGPEQQRLLALAGELALAEAVWFAGFTQDVTPYLARSDLFVLPSRTEGAPLALLEALALGIPVVASRVGGIPEVTEGGSAAFLVAPDDPEALADGILEALTDKVSRTAKRSAGLKVVTQYDASFILPQLIGEYHAVLARGGES